VEASPGLCICSSSIWASSASHAARVSVSVLSKVVFSISAYFEWCGKIGEGLVMGLWHEQAVSRKKRPTIQKGQRDAIFKDHGGLFLTTDDAIERARRTGA
jgi:hypothetical protein